MAAQFAEVRRRRARGGEPKEEDDVGVKGESYPRSPIYTEGRRFEGTVVVLHYPDCICGSLPRGSATWGSGSNNRATRRIMAVMCCSYR
jgi:hypothetical protein